MNIPVTKKENISEKISGHLINDYYRWLENADSEETKNWVLEQNKYAESFLKNDIFKTFSDELVKNFKTTTFSTPHTVKGRKKYFYTERQPDEDQHSILVRNGLNGDPIKLVDPNGMNNDNTISIDFWNPSRSGKYLAYGLSQGGTEMATLYIKDVDTGKNLDDKIINCRYSAVRWLPDDSGFFYTRNPRPNTVPKGEEHMHVKVYLHKLGDNSDNDELIFGKDRPKDDMIGLGTSIDENYLFIQVSQSWTRNDIYIYNRIDKTTTPLVLGIDAKFSLYFAKDKAFILTNHEANNYKIISVSLDNLFTPIEKWETFIPEKDCLLEDISITEDKIIISYLINACSKVYIFDYQGNKQGELPLPTYSSVGSISTHREEKEFFYSVGSFTFPTIIYRFNPDKNNYSEYRKFDNPINPDNYVVKQEWYESKDGTKISMFIVHKNDIKNESNNPTILYGYGGFDSSQTPGFNRNWVPWFERNGIFAVANIRGGGEFGADWHKSAMKDKKQNSFDDFIAAAEFLIDKKYTSKDHLGILGGSNGGLLVSAVAVQKPNLFKAVCSRVPLTDMVRFHKFGMAIRWTNEFGNPEIKEELDNILKWSPYHNIKDGVEYPNFLFTTGLKDSRVDPLHARKMAAILQNANQHNNVFIITDLEAGHGAGKPISKIVESQAFALSFFTKYLKLEV